MVSYYNSILISQNNEANTLDSSPDFEMHYSYIQTHREWLMEQKLAQFLYLLTLVYLYRMFSCSVQVCWSTCSTATSTVWWDGGSRLGSQQVFKRSCPNQKLNKISPCCVKMKINRNKMSDTFCDKQFTVVNDRSVLIPWRSSKSRVSRRVFDETKIHKIAHKLL